jgi:hypothetical protein
MTIRGDIIARNASNVTARLGLGAANRVLKSDGSDIGYGQVTEAMQLLANNTTNDVSTAAHGYAPIAPNDGTKYLDGTGGYSIPAGGGVSGSNMLALKVYAPSSQTVYTTGTANTMGDVDATNMKVTFTAPASGNVLIRLSAFCDEPGATASETYWGLREGSTDLNVTTRILRTTEQHYTSVAMYVSGLTPNTGHTYKWSFGSSSTAFNMRIIVQDGTAMAKWGPGIMEVWAAP